MKIARSAHCERALAIWFDLYRDNNWSYMPLEKSRDLLQGVTEPLEGLDVGLWFYGTTGYGKSHILAALACNLLSTGSRVIYIPDCQECLQNPVGYVRAALLLAWGGDVALQAQIMGLESRFDILRFFMDIAAEGCRAIFVIDHTNALESVGGSGGSAGDAKSKESLEIWLYECSSQHMTFVGLSADSASVHKLQKSQRNHSRVNA